jgi:CSLREA domain-containing protein
LLEDRLVPATFLVTTTLDVVDPNDGQLSLREAISAANASPGADTIIVPAGVYQLALRGADDTNAAGDFDITGSTLFQGAGAGSTVIDGQQIDRVFDVRGTAPHSINVTFQGLTVRNGLADAGGGGGIRVGNADLLLQDCAVTGNATAGDGGGISNAALPATSDETLVRTTVNGNVAVFGGGISVPNDRLGQGGLLTATDCKFGHNAA